MTEQTPTTEWVAVHQQQLVDVENFVQRVLNVARPALATGLTNDLELALAHLVQIQQHNPRTADPNTA